MGRAIPSVVEDRQAIEKTINGMIRLAEGHTRRKYPLRHCLRIAQCEELIVLCDKLKEVAEAQLLIKRDQQGTKSQMVKKYHELSDDLNQLAEELGFDRKNVDWARPAGRGHEVVLPEDCMICDEN